MPTQLRTVVLRSVVNLCYVHMRPTSFQFVLLEIVLLHELAVTHKLCAARDTKPRGGPWLPRAQLCSSCFKGTLQEPLKEPLQET